jgi:hypothetical protein
MGHKYTKALSYTQALLVFDVRATVLYTNKVQTIKLLPDKFPMELL